jgi:hypothetical protein
VREVATRTAGRRGASVEVAITTTSSARGHARASSRCIREGARPGGPTRPANVVVSSPRRTARGRRARGLRRRCGARSGVRR